MEAPIKAGRAWPCFRAHDRSDGASARIEGGFTLVELMVVLLIMAILLAIAIPAFLGVKSGAYDRSTQSNLTDAIISGKTSYVATSAYSTAASLEATALGSLEPNLTFTAGLPTGSGLHVVSVNVSTDGQQLLLVGWSASGTCWAAEDNEGDTTAAGDSTNAITNTPTIGGDQYNHWTSGTSSTCSNAVPGSGTSGWLSHF
jgi:type IV pilus assembly protein PilA